jgi:hypothetical protein
MYKEINKNQGTIQKQALKYAFISLLQTERNVVQINQI